MSPPCRSDLLVAILSPRQGRGSYKNAETIYVNTIKRPLISDADERPLEPATEQL